MKVLQPGFLSLLQDAGRFGHHRIGLTTGGALDQEAMQWANRLCGNALNCTVIEISMGGLILEAQVDTFVVLTGSSMPLKINQHLKAAWQTQPVRAGETIEVGYTQSGCRAYLAVSGGFQIQAAFGSCATVVREHIGGLTGHALQQGDVLPCTVSHINARFCLDAPYQPAYHQRVMLRVVLGYQQAHFSAVQQALFFSSEYTVSDQCDRMGYRLTGRAIKADIEGILSEGICYGAIQIPANGQPIVLLNDRQTIGGYPKIGSVLSLDLARLSQLLPGGKVRFTPISQAEAHNALQLQAYRFFNTPMTVLA